jgi:AcrR family transcriptional regulator
MTTAGLDRTARREREIIDAAAKLFSERGYSSTTIRDIGAQAGLNHATTNYYFRGKAAVLFAIYQEALDGFFAGLKTVTGRPDEALAQLVRVAVAAAVHRRDQTAVYFQELRWLDQLLPPDMVAIVRERQHVPSRRSGDRGRGRGRHGPVGLPERRHRRTSRRR